MGMLDGILGGGGSKFDDSAWREEQKKILDGLESKIPQEYVSADAQQFTPEELAQMQVGPSAMQGVSTDPRLANAQMAALAQLQETGKSGFDVQDLAALRKAQSENAMAERGSRNAIMANAQARGASGSGLDMAAQLQNQQASADRNAQQGLDIAAQGRQRALQAMMQSGQMAGDIRNQDFGEQSAKAQAADQIAQFNAKNLAGAASQNLGNRQSTGLQNSAGQNGFNQQTYQNQSGIAQQRFNGSVNSQNAAAAADAAKRASNSAMMGGLINTAATVGATMYGGPAAGAAANAATKPKQ